MVFRTGRWGGRARACVLLGGLAWGCGPGKPADTDDTGADSETGGDATTAPTTGTLPTTGSETSEGTTAAPDDGKLCVPGPSPLRRLSNVQYRSTLLDLLPGVSLPDVALLPDERLEGFAGIADLQPPWELAEQFYAEAAADVAAAAVAESEKFLPCPPDGGPTPAACGNAFIAELATRAFRRPLTPDEGVELVAAFDAELAEKGFAPALESTMARVLRAEPFLHLIEHGGAPVEGQPELVALTGFELASRLSYFLWDSMPDDALLEAAAAGVLDTPEGLEAEARRMLADPRAPAVIARHVRQWLYLNDLAVAGFEPEWVPVSLQVSMNTEIEVFTELVVFQGERTLDALLTSNLGFVDATLGELYGVDAPDEGFAQVELDPERRPGVLTRAGWLAMRAVGERHSPFTRGLSMLDSLFCIHLPPPPPDVEVIPPDTEPDATTREIYDAILAEPGCANCHATAQHLGYALENYDRLGAWRDAENGKPIDASAQVDAELDPEISGAFVGAAALMQRLAQSEVVHACATRKAYLRALGRSLSEADACDLQRLQDKFQATAGDLHELQIQIALSDGFRHRRAP